MNAIDSWDQRYKNQIEEGKNDFGPRASFITYINDYLKRGCNTNLGNIRVLDFGCGKGGNMIYMLEKGLDVVGFDASSEGVDLARLHLEGRLDMAKDEAERRVIESKMEEGLPYHDESFDVIINYGVLHQTTRAGIENAFKEMYRVLKKGGEVFFHTRSNEQAQFGELMEPPIYDDIDGRLIVTQGPTLWLPIKGSPILWHFFSKYELRNLAKTYNFTLEGLKEFKHPTREEGENFDRVSFEGILIKR